MHIWLPDLSAADGPKYSAIVDAVAGAIRSGELRPGARMPTQRELAGALGVDLTTVTRAYGLLRQAGLIEGAGKLGSFVRNDALPPVAGETASETGMNVPPQPGFALLPDAIRTGTAALLRAGRHSPILQYQPSGGNLLDRMQAAASLSDRGVPAVAEEMVITAGSQHALHAIVAGTLAAGDRLLCAPFVYPGMIALAARFGLRLVPVACDGEGMRPDALSEALREGGGTLYLVPTNDNPTAATMGTERRAAIAAVARKHGTTIIEDDAYGTLPARALPPIASLAPELTWYIAGTSKVISPVLRVAHVRAPSIAQAARLSADIHETAIMAPPLNAALVSTWLRDGTFGRLVEGVRAEAVARQRIAARCLRGLRYDTHPQGYHLWLHLPGGASPHRIAEAIGAMGLSVVPGDAFRVDEAAAGAFLRISMGGALDHARLERALRQLGEFVSTV